MTDTCGMLFVLSIVIVLSFFLRHFSRLEKGRILYGLVENKIVL